tara:strand:+ start:913 stop:1554 length:642 start_codon:yes stop_codon:yes gene_type:complete
MLDKQKKFGLIFSNTNRSFQYLSYLKKIDLNPSTILVFSKKKLSRKFEKLLPKSKCSFFSTNDINNKKIEKKILKSSEKYFIYSGYPSKMIKNTKLLNQKIFLHSHTGKLPFFKGSTTIFYSILKTNSIWCSTFRMSSKLDSGKVFLMKKYKLSNELFVDFNKSDNLIRIKNLSQVLKKKLERKIVLNNKSLEKYYYVAHPVIRCLAKLKVKS